MWLFSSHARRRKEWSQTSCRTVVSGKCVQLLWNIFSKDCACVRMCDSFARVRICRSRHTHSWRWSTQWAHRDFSTVRFLKIWCDCFSAKQDCCVANFVLYFNGCFYFVKTVSALPHFYSFCDRFHSNLKSPRDLHFGSVPTGLRTAAGLNGRSFFMIIIVVVVIFPFTPAHSLVLPWCYAVLWSAIFTTLYTVFNLLSGTRRLRPPNRIKSSKLNVLWRWIFLSTV